MNPSDEKLHTKEMDGVPEEVGFYFAKTVAGWCPLQVIEGGGGLITAGLGQPVEDYPAWSQKIEPPNVESGGEYS